MQVVEIENNREDIIMTYLEKAIKDGYASAMCFFSFWCGC